MTVCVLGGIGLFHLSCQMCVELFLVLPYFPFDLCRVCMKIQFHSISWNLNFTPDIDNSRLLSFFLCLPNFVILLIFSKNQLFVSLIFFYCFSVFNSTDFSSYLHYLFLYYVQRRNSLWYQSSIHWGLFYGPGYSLSSYTKLNVYQDVRIPRYILLGYEKTV